MKSSSRFAEEYHVVYITLSTLFATFLLCWSAWVVTPQISTWHQLETNERTWMIAVSAYAIILTFSGWLYGRMKWRAAGIVHATLMSGIAALVLYGFLSGQLTRHEAGPAEAIAAILRPVVVIVGVIAAICGVCITRCVFSGRDNPEKEELKNLQS